MSKSKLFNGVTSSGDRIPRTQSRETRFSELNLWHSEQDSRRLDQNRRVSRHVHFVHVHAVDWRFPSMQNMQTIMCLGPESLGNPCHVYSWRMICSSRAHAWSLTRQTTADLQTWQAIAGFHSRNWNLHTLMSKRVHFHRYNRQRHALFLRRVCLNDQRHRHASRSFESWFSRAAAFVCSIECWL